ncbi:signal peptidase I [Proteiniclasticum sp. C24MP]|uniref:signal peptidase I n=1 Tax=Proteiniclasticum sp. C24MP TaxID=3374101 RepID=UPI0037541606
MKTESEQSDAKFRSIVTEWMKSMIVGLLTALFVTTFLFSSAVVKGSSMYPTLHENDRLIVKKYETILKTEEYRRGDIIVFESPLENEDKYFIKRVIGLPGDKITISDGKVHVNDEIIEEPYIDQHAFTETLFFGDDYIVSENELFVMGDNRLPGKSNDSRSFGSISIDRIEGKIVLRVLPLDRIDSDL